MIPTTDVLSLILSFMAGIALGAVFFGGLWLTVHIGVGSMWPGVLFLSSLLLRTTIVLVGFYFVSATHWERLLLCFLGFISIRFLITLWVRGKGRLHAHHSR